MGQHRRCHPSLRGCMEPGHGRRSLGKTMGPKPRSRWEGQEMVPSMVENHHRGHPVMPGHPWVLLPPPLLWVTGTFFPRDGQASGGSVLSEKQRAPVPRLRGWEIPDGSSCGTLCPAESPVVIKRCCTCGSRPSVGTWVSPAGLHPPRAARRTALCSVSPPCHHPHDADPDAASRLALQGELPRSPCPNGVLPSPGAGAAGHGSGLYFRVTQGSASLYTES